METFLTSLPDDGEQSRQLRGLAIADLGHIRQGKLGYKVPSQFGYGSYLVNFDDGPYCSCTDFAGRARPCKHIYAVWIALGRHDAMDPDTAVRYAQPWSAYTAAQVHEGALFKQLLRELCDTVPTPPQPMGRRRLPLADMLYTLGLKVYSTLSTRRAMSHIMDAAEAGMMDKTPTYSTTIRYLEKDGITPVLRELIRVSALPLRGVEHDFALDSSGFASTSYHRWFDHKWGNSRKETKWVKLHIMCGVQTNIITVADATVAQSADTIYLPGFVRATAEHFAIREVSADAAYSSWKNVDAVAAAGGTPFIAFKKGAVVRQSNGRANPTWERMYHHFTLHEADFNHHYHKRSNVETTFYMIKAKFGDVVRSKTDTAQVNEVLLKVLCHNICVLVRAMFALGITPEFQEPTFASESALDANVTIN